MRTPANLRPLLWLVAFVVWSLGALLARRTGIWIGIGSGAVSLGALVLIVESSELLPRLRPTWFQLSIGAMAGLFMVMVTRILFPWVLQHVPAVELQTATLYMAFGKISMIKLLVMTLVIVGEELVWRGAVQRGVSRYVGTNWAVGLTAVLYAVAHLPVGSPLLFVVALCCGLYWSLLVALSRSLVPSLIAHLLWDSAILVLWPLLQLK